MRYALAMGLVTGKRTAARPSNPEICVAYRFGAHVLLNAEPTGPAYISWTPTEQDMKAEDWNVREPDGTPVAPVYDPPLTAGGGTGTGTGWKRA